MTINNEILRKAFDGSFYTIVGAGGNLQEWKNGYQDLLNKDNIGTISEWVEFTGKDMDEEFNLFGKSAYKDDLHFLAFSLDGLDINKLAMFKIRMGDRWFDDIVGNLV